MEVVDISLIAAGIVLLVAGAWFVVEAGSALARRWGISPLWVGLTVVALGTSLPELTVTAFASYTGSGELAISNVVGSNILNTLIVLGTTAAIAPIPAGGVTVRRNLALVAAASFAVWLLAYDGLIHQAEGLLLLALVPIYVIHVYREEKRGWLPAPEAPVGFAGMHWAIQVTALVVGLVVLLFGGVALVQGAQNIAERAGISPRIIGLTVVAVGTSLPELATSLVAAYRRKVDLALGNLIGSNMLNLLFVLGAAGTLSDVPVTASLLRIDMPLMILSALLLVRFAATRARVSRVEGALLLGLYLGYIGYVLGGL